MSLKMQILSIAFAALGSVPVFAQQEVDGVVTGGAIRPLFVAAPDFISESEDATGVAREIGEVFHADLLSTGLFFMIPNEKLTPTLGAFEENVKFNQWQDISTELLIKGSVDRESDGTIEVKFRIYDVLAEKEIGEGVKLRGPVREWRRMAHKIADAVYTNITGEGAYFDSRIVYIAQDKNNEQRQRIAIMDSDGANVRYLTSGDARVLSPRFASNNRDVIYTALQNGEPRVMLIDVSNGIQKPLASLTGFSYAPRISPDGQFALASSVNDAGNSDIIRMDLESGESTTLISNGAINSAPSISPDGQKFVFESNLSGKQQLYVAPSTGGDAVRISSGEGRYITPAWSPEGDLIAFSKIIDDQYHIGIMNADGSQERLLTTAYVDEAPAWAPNGRAIVFYRKAANANDAPKLFSISLSGRNMMAIETPEYARDPSWSGLLQ